MSDNWKTWTIIFFIGTTIILLIRNDFSSDESTDVPTTTVAEVSPSISNAPVAPPPPVKNDGCPATMTIDGREPNYLFCETGTTLTSPLNLRTGMVKLSMSATRTSGYAVLCRAELVDSEGRTVIGSYNGIMLRDVSSDRAMWSTRIERSGTYTARISGGQCRWALGISQ